MLSFGGEADAPPGAYLIRGGIAWPRPDGGEMTGYVVLCGRHEASGRIWVFEEQRFLTVDWLKDSQLQNDPAFAPIAPFFQTAWHFYLSRIFHSNLVADEQIDYLHEIWRCESIKPGPIMPKRRLKDKITAENMALIRIFIQDRQEKLVYRPGGGVDSAIEEYEAHAGASEGRRIDLPPALEALAVALEALGKVYRAY